MSKALIFDCYVDEPGSLGVPPYVHPEVRAAYGSALDSGLEAEYFTIDMLRQGRPLPSADVVVVIAGTAVPGRYLRAMPASRKELLRVADQLRCESILGGPDASNEELEGKFDHLARRDAAAMLYDLAKGRELKQRWRTPAEWERWLLLGTEMVKYHPDFPQPLVAEVETYRGCVRWKSGGCSFCIEPLKGEPKFREPKAIIEEVRKMHALGVRNFRLGAQTCFISYKAHLDGSDTPRPNPAAIEELLSGIAQLGVEVLHLDNANPAVMATHPQETEEILRSIVRHCTDGNVLALGLESTDPKVHEANNLNATAEQCLAAVRMINAAGRERGPKGLPYLLPGLNFISGLEGETEKSLDLDRAFLRQVVEEGLLLRRINLRQVVCSRREFSGGASHSAFIRFKEWVRKEVDHPMLIRIAPEGTVLKGIYTELADGNMTFGRQIGTYPLLVGIPYKIPLGRFFDGAIVGWGERSITALEWPLHINSCHITAMEALPSIGRKRAMRLFRGRPFVDAAALLKCIDDEAVGRKVIPYLAFD
jgi:radical SAM superfamily enzyme with C-terminal helix-hairpin-helix motif